MIQKKRLDTSKKILVFEFIIAMILLIGYVLFSYLNGAFFTDAQYKMIDTGVYITLTEPFNVTQLQYVLNGWEVLMTVSAGYYFWKSKNENVVKLSIGLLNSIPDYMKEKADPNAILSSSLNMRNSN